MIYDNFQNLDEEEKKTLELKDWGTFFIWITFFEDGKFYEKLIGGCKLTLKSVLFIFNKELYKTFLIEAIVVFALSIPLTIFSIAAVVFLELGIFAGMPKDDGYEQERNFGLYCVAVAMYFFMFVNLVVMIVANFWYSDTFRKISLKTEKILFQIPCDPKDKPLCNKECAEYSCKFFGIGLVESLVMTIFMLFTFLLIYIPGVNILFIVLLTSITNGYFALKCVYLRKGKFWDLWSFFYNNFWFMFGIGFGSYILSQIPLIGRVLQVFAIIVAGQRIVILKSYYESNQGEIALAVQPTIQYVQNPDVINPSVVSQPIAFAQPPENQKTGLKE